MLWDRNYKDYGSVRVVIRTKEGWIEWEALRIGPIERIGPRLVAPPPVGRQLN